MRTVQPVLLELDLAEEEAARVLGASRWTTFRKVVLPAILPGITGGGLLTFARALGEFGSVVVVSGNILNKTLTAPVFIFQLISQFKAEQAAAVSALLFGLSFVVVLVTDGSRRPPRRLGMSAHATTARPTDAAPRARTATPHGGGCWRPHVDRRCSTWWCAPGAARRDRRWTALKRASGRR